MISITGKLISRINWGDDNISSVYKGVKKIWPTETDGIVINLDTNNPDEIIGGNTMNTELKNIADQTHWYCGKLTENGMLICQVGHNVINTDTMVENELPTQFYNGVSMLTSYAGAQNSPYSYYGDLFIRFPKFSVINNILSETKAQVKWLYGVEVPGWVNWDGNWLIGLSSTAFENNKIYCHPKVHDTSRTFDIWQERLEIMNNTFDTSKINGKYGFFTYWQRCILSYLYWSVYGTTRDLLTTNPHYFLGIDAFCSSWTEYLDGIVINDRVPTITRPDGSTRIGPRLPGTGGIGAGGWISKIYLTPYLDIIPKEWNATRDTGFCSHGWSSNLNNVIPRMKGGMGTNDEVIGCGYDRPGWGPESNTAAVRLTYHGKIIETKDTDYFKRVKPINGGIYYDEESGTDKIYNPF